MASREHEFHWLSLNFETLYSHFLALYATREKECSQWYYVSTELHHQVKHKVEEIPGQGTTLSPRTMQYDYSKDPTPLAYHKPLSKHKIHPIRK